MWLSYRFLHTELFSWKVYNFLKKFISSALSWSAWSASQSGRDISEHLLFHIWTSLLHGFSPICSPFLAFLFLIKYIFKYHQSYDRRLCHEGSRNMTSLAVVLSEINISDMRDFWKPSMQICRKYWSANILSFLSSWSSWPTLNF